VAARRDGNEAVVLFADDGVGIPEGYDASSGAHFGLSLVAGLVAQIGGTIELSREGGTSYEIRFPIE
jgi:two-component sensor histidine kinase